MSNDWWDVLYEENNMQTNILLILFLAHRETVAQIMKYVNIDVKRVNLSVR